MLLQSKKKSHHGVVEEIRLYDTVPVCEYVILSLQFSMSLTGQFAACTTRPLMDCLVLPHTRH